MKWFRRKKNKNYAMTLNDCVEYYRKNPQYRYVVVVGKERLPRSMCETMKDAKVDSDTHFISGGVLPIEIIDLAFYEKENIYAAKRP